MPSKRRTVGSAEGQGASVAAVQAGKKKSRTSAPGRRRAARGATQGAATTVAGEDAASKSRDTGQPTRGSDDSPQVDGNAKPHAELPSVPAQALAQIQSDYLQRLQRMFSAGTAPRPRDRRFAGESWQDGGIFAWSASLYELNADFLKRLSESIEGDRRARERIQFATQQWIDAMSPANYLMTNPEAQRKLIESRGESLKAGLHNLASDIAKGRISQTDESAFEVGVNVANTPGAVVFENDLIQLIQYQPSTPMVGARPILMVPPCINKFYIMDLQPENSLVAYAVSQGNTVFMLSWRNIKPPLDALTWDDYIETGMFEAIRVVREISGQDQINMLGFCVGGTILAAALAALAARGEQPAASVTLLTTLLDFAEPGVLGVFVDEAHASYREKTIGKRGIMSGKELAATFSALRPNDLVWNYVVSNYLKGDSPPAFDLLYWNSDGTNLPGPMFCWYFRHMYLQNELRVPNALMTAGERVDLGRIDAPSFVYASRDDHIVPWRSAYASTQLLKGDRRFVLGASGHIAGVINPPAKNKRNYWENAVLPESADQWFAGAEEVPGSWWPKWAVWVESHRGPAVTAPRALGSATYRPIEPAPGRYVKESGDL